MWCSSSRSAPHQPQRAPGGLGPLVSAQQHQRTQPGDLRLVLLAIQPQVPRMPAAVGAGGSLVDEVARRERLPRLLGPLRPGLLRGPARGDEEERVLVHRGVERALGDDRRVGLPVLGVEELLGVEVPQPDDGGGAGGAGLRVQRELPQRDGVGRKAEPTAGVPANDERVAGLDAHRLDHPRVAVHRHPEHRRALGLEGQPSQPVIGGPEGLARSRRSWPPPWSRAARQTRVPSLHPPTPANPRIPRHEELPSGRTRPRSSGPSRPWP